MQILIFEGATCVLNIYMIVAPGFVSNLLCKWIRSVANGNETLSTYAREIFVLILFVVVAIRVYCSLLSVS